MSPPPPLLEGTGAQEGSSDRRLAQRETPNLARSLSPVLHGHRLTELLSPLYGGPSESQRICCTVNGSSGLEPDRLTQELALLTSVEPLETTKCCLPVGVVVRTVQHQN